MEQLRCFECGQPADHEHHVVPRVLGGTRTIPLCGLHHGMVHGLKLTHHRTLVRAGLKRAVAQGKVLGRPMINGEVEKRVHVLRAKGYGMIKIAKEVGIGVGTVVRMVNSSR